ncbi:hypothetical protein GCM10023206_01310 [Acinetobacter puyangensis]|uniref:Phospholipid transport system transporter-binding protein n=1 Tax=Acinetobacter puyangensis TaxID=1096779 RepID=A0A240E8H2_9GAMM|nr:STAS domain-containing protein [Acinetobacter puyangensis]SNX44519.1 phospholipid transport system transporter-binding protein [Acinetobacter puyangensis]
MTAVEFKNNQLYLNGQVDFDNAQQIYQQGLVQLKQQQSWPIQVNLSNLKHGNTLVLAIFIQWLRASPSMQSLKLTAVPEKMRGIIRASNLQQLLEA